MQDFSIKLISGAHTALFWDVLYDMSGSIIALENTETVISFLYDDGYHDEAIMLIKAYYEILGIEWPEEMVFIESNQEFKSPFLHEFLLDTEEIILDIVCEKANNDSIYS